MPLVWAGVLLLALRACEIGPVANWSWGWVLAPLACAFVWFEFVEPLFGLDRKPDVGLELEVARRKRVVERFPQFWQDGARKRAQREGEAKAGVSGRARD